MKPMHRIRDLAMVVIVGFTTLLGPKVLAFQLIGPTTSVWRFWTNATDPGYPDWFQKNFDDRAWSSGTGLFGNDSGYPYPFVTPTPPASVVNRFFARTHFTWSGATAGVMLRGTNFIDDGAVVYLNGVEIYRYNMPAGPTSFETRAVTAVSEPNIVVANIHLDNLSSGEANPLFSGDNVIAVETASTPGSGDTVWGLSLYVMGDCFPLPQISPGAITQTACRDATFVASYSQCLDSPSVQWYRNVGSGDEPVAGVVGTSLTVTNVSSADSGQYFFRVSSFFGIVESPRSTLTVTPDTQGPKIVSVVASNLNHPYNDWIVTFDEPVAVFGGADIPVTWVIETGGQIPQRLTVFDAMIDPTNPGRVRLYTLEERIPGVFYTYATDQSIVDACGDNASPAGMSGAVLQESATPSLSITRPTPASVQISWVPVAGFHLFQAPTVKGPFTPVAGDPQGTHTVTLPEEKEKYFRLGP